MEEMKLWNDFVIYRYINIDIDICWNQIIRKLCCLHSFTNSRELIVQSNILLEHFSLFPFLSLPFFLSLTLSVFLYLFHSFIFSSFISLLLSFSFPFLFLFTALSFSFFISDFSLSVFLFPCLFFSLSFSFICFNSLECVDGTQIHLSQYRDRVKLALSLSNSCWAKKN